MRKPLLTFLFSIAANVLLQAQFITHGPVVGAVTSESCKMYLRTAVPASVEIELSTSLKFPPEKKFIAITTQTNDQSVIALLDNLKSNTKYFYQLSVNGVRDSIRGFFKTFPKDGEVGEYTFITGSCQETENMKVFDVIPLHKPLFMMHTGDFTYPDYQIKPDFSNSFDTVALSYRKRYDEKIMKQMLYTVPIDYMYDDNDYVGGSGGRYCKNDFKSFIRKGKVYNEMYALPFPPHWRRNVIKGYDEFFPHYDLPDTTEGIYHSFKMGNAEFFVLDRNSPKEFPNLTAFTYDSAKNKWKFNPPPGYALFGKKQMDWLKKSMLASTADWKFIVSGVPLNGACEKLIRGGVNIQNMHYKDWFGFHIAWGFSQYWAAFPDERNDFMNWLKTNSIKNVIVLSGDTHHNVMDDGKNAGLPEMNASGLSVSTTELAKYLKLIGNLTGQFNMKKIWNKGGNGLTSKENKNAFGRVRINNREFVELSIIDEDNKVVSSFVVPFQK